MTSVLLRNSISRLSPAAAPRAAQIRLRALAGQFPAQSRGMATTADGTGKPQDVAIIAGVGPGTGAAIARRFASSHYSVVLLARSTTSYSDLVTELQSQYGQHAALGIQTDIADASSVKAAMENVKSTYGISDNDAGKAHLKAAIFNASGSFTRKPFLEVTDQEMRGGWDVSVMGAFHFAQSTLPFLLRSTTNSTAGPAPALVFTGATASVKGSAKFAAFAAPKFGLRALTQSLAREFGPQGVHVAHAVIDGVIDIPRTKGWDLGEAGKIDPREIAETYWNLCAQGRTGFTWEVDIRPGVEKW